MIIIGNHIRHVLRSVPPGYAIVIDHEGKIVKDVNGRIVIARYE